MHTKNYQYILVILLVFAVGVFFLTSTLWIHEEQADRTANYDNAFEFWRWTIKVNNAQYSPDTGTFSFDVYMLWTEADEPELPTVTIYNGKATSAKTPLKHLSVPDSSYDPTEIPQYQELDHLRAYKYRYIVEVPSEYWYVTVDFSHTATVIKEVTATTDVFGQIKEFEPVIEEKTFNKKVQIDYRTVTVRAEGE